MWRFLPGCEPPPKKVKSNVSESAKNYEKNKRQQVFQNSWKQGRTWLVCEDNVMFCSVCIEAEAVDATISHKNSFTSGNCQFKLESIKLHKELRNHKSAKAIVAAKNQPCETPVVKFFLPLDAEIIGCTDDDEERDSGADDNSDHEEEVVDRLIQKYL